MLAYFWHPVEEPDPARRLTVAPSVPKTFTKLQSAGYSSIQIFGNIYNIVYFVPSITLLLLAVLPDASLGSLCFHCVD